MVVTILPLLGQGEIEVIFQNLNAKYTMKKLQSNCFFRHHYKWYIHFKLLPDAIWYDECTFLVEGLQRSEHFHLKISQRTKCQNGHQKEMPGHGNELQIAGYWYQQQKNV